MRKIICLFLSSVMMVAALGGCSSSPQQPNAGAAPTALTSTATAPTVPSSVASATGAKAELVIYHHLAEMVDWYDAFCKDVMAKYPNIRIEQEVQKEASTLQVKYASGDDPEIVAGPQTQQYIELGKYNELSSMPGIERLDPLCKEIVTDVNLGGIYKVPLCNRSGGLFYNKTITDELGLKQPNTWDEFVENLRTIKKAKPDVIPFYMYGGNQAHALAFICIGQQMAKEGAVEIQRAMNSNDSALLQFDAPGGYLETYAQRILDLQAEGLVDSEIVVNANDDMAYEAFATDKTVYLVNGTWWYGGARGRFPEIDGKVGLAPIPPIMDGMGPFTVAGPDSAVSTSATSEYQEQIGLVMEMLFSDPYLKSYSEKRGAPSSFTGVESNWGGIAGQVSENWSKYPIITQMTPVTGFGLSDITKFVQELMVGAYTPSEFAKEFRNRWDTAYKNASR